MLPFTVGAVVGDVVVGDVVVVLISPLPIDKLKTIIQEQVVTKKAKDDAAHNLLLTAIAITGLQMRQIFLCRV